MLQTPPANALEYIAGLDAALARATAEHVALRAIADSHETHKVAIRLVLRPSKGVRLPSAMLDGVEVTEDDVDVARKLQTTASRRAAKAFDSQCRILDNIRRSLDYYTWYPGIAGEASRLAHQDVGVFAEVVGAREMFLWFWPTAITTSDEQATAAVGVVYGSNGISLIDGKMVALGGVESFADVLKFVGVRMAFAVADEPVEAAEVVPVVEAVPVAAEPVLVVVGAVSPAAALIEDAHDKFAAISIDYRNAVKNYDDSGRGTRDSRRTTAEAKANSKLSAKLFKAVPQKAFFAAQAIAALTKDLSTDSLALAVLTAGRTLLLNYSFTALGDAGAVRSAVDAFDALLADHGDQDTLAMETQKLASLLHAQSVTAGVSATMEVVHSGVYVASETSRWVAAYLEAVGAPGPDGGERVDPVADDASVVETLPVVDRPVPTASGLEVVDIASRVIVNDAVEGLRGLADGMIDCVVTSPPYYGLRDYGVDGQIGLEQSPEEYIERLVAVFREVRRVLADHGTVWVNIGDSYHTDGRKGLASMGTGKNSAYSTHTNRKAFGTKPKDLIGIPWMLAFALRADGWYLRSEVIWSKACGMPESVRDRPTKSHETVFLLSKQETYFYDDTAVKEPAITGHRGSKFNAGKTAVHQSGRSSDAPRTDDGTRSLRDVWHLPTTPFKGAHFATMPRGLAEICIQAGTSEHGKCPGCGSPWVRQREREGGGFREEGDRGFPVRPQMTGGNTWEPVEYRETGWRQTCSCATHQPVPAVVLDPFMGAGTTALVANRLGRSAVGIELNPDFALIAKARLGDSGFRMGIDFQIQVATESVLEMAA